MAGLEPEWEHVHGPHDVVRRPHEGRHRGRPLFPHAPGAARGQLLPRPPALWDGHHQAPPARALFGFFLNLEARESDEGPRAHELTLELMRLLQSPKDGLTIGLRLDAETRALRSRGVQSSRAPRSRTASGLPQTKPSKGAAPSAGRAEFQFLRNLCAGSAAAVEVYNGAATAPNEAWRHRDTGYSRSEVHVSAETVLRGQLARRLALTARARRRSPR
mmetsp:Transcript_4906/g.16365  ORF Transcript_4906/g.16365 Transcript_4906/m.16365 type:complete len:218 (-) Transcript_4906:632-1285(-)